MFRLLGFIVGSIASIAALVLMVGMPSFHLDGDSLEEDRFDVVIQQLKQKQQSGDRPAHFDSELSENASDSGATATIAETQHPAEGEVSDVLDVPAEPEPGSSPSGYPEPTPQTETETAGLAVADIANDDPVNNALAIDTPVEDALPVLEEPQEPGWQSFWNPFRSEIAARGFVRRLENVTGLDYRVVKVKNGVYEVAFSYNDDDERSNKLTQIAAATGLDLSDVGQ